MLRVDNIVILDECARLEAEVVYRWENERNGKYRYKRIWAIMGKQ